MLTSRTENCRYLWWMNGEGLVIVAAIPCNSFTYTHVCSAAYWCKCKHSTQHTTDTQQQLTKTLVSCGRRGRVLPLCCLHDSGRPRRGQGCLCIFQRSAEWDLLASGLLQHASHSGARGRRGSIPSAHTLLYSYMTCIYCAPEVWCIKLCMTWAASLWNLCNNTHSATSARHMYRPYMICTLTY